MSKLVCEICGQEKKVPTCCEESMVLKGEFLCCCSSNGGCQHHHIPECCGVKMRYVN